MLDEQRKELQPEGMQDQTQNGVKDTSVFDNTNNQDADDAHKSDVDSDDDEPHKGRSTRRVSSRTNDLKRKRDEEEARREKEKQARLEPPGTILFKKVLKDIEKKKKEIKRCEDEINTMEEKLRLNACHRTKVLGRDRYWNRYYWFERNGMPYGGAGSGAANLGYANGRLWVQGPDELERAGFIDLPVEEMSKYSLNFGVSVHKRKELEEGPTQLHNAHEWGYYNDPDSLDKLIGWLDDRGHRERALRKELQAWHDKIVAYMAVMNARLKDMDGKKALSEEPIVGIATRKKTYVEHNTTKYPCLAWTNVMAKRELGHLHSEGAPVKKAVVKGKVQPIVMEKPTTRRGTRYR